MLKKLVTVTAMMAVCAVSVVGCATEEDVIVDKPTEESPYPALSDAQITKVFSSLDDTLKSADKDLNGEALQARLEDPALAMRQGQYKLASAKDKKVTPLPTKRGTVTVTASKGWPRVLVNMVSEGKDKPTYVEAIRQNDARSQFKLWQWVRLFPKETVPATAQTSKGAPIIPADSTELVKTPKAAVADYGKHLLSAKDLQKAGFADDPMAKAIRGTDKSYRDSLGDKYSLSHKITPDDTFMAVGLEDGGALVFAHYVDKLTFTPETDRATLKLQGDVAQLLGDDGKADEGATVTFRVTALILVPEKGSKDPVKVIGGEQVLTAAEKLE